MTVPSYPLTMPTSPSNFRTSEWRIVRSVAVSVSPFTMKSETADFGGAVWTTTVTLPPMLKADAGAWQVFFMQLHGRHGSFLLGDPDAKTIQGSATGTMSANGDHSVGAYTIQVDGLNASQTTGFKKGDYVQFGSGATSKLHMIVEDIPTTSSGGATLEIEPPLKTAVANDSVIVYDSAKAVMRMDTNELSWNADQVSTYGISFSCSEVI